MRLLSIEKVMQFELSNSFEENLEIFKEEVSKLNPEYAEILFENIHLLIGETGKGRDRKVIQSFNNEVLKAIENRPDQIEDSES